MGCILISITCRQLGSLEHPNPPARSKATWAWRKRLRMTFHASNAESIDPMTILTPGRAILGSNDTCPVLLCPRRVRNMPIPSEKICLVCSFHMAISQQVCMVARRDRAHFHSTSNEDSKSTDTSDRAHKFNDISTYKKLYTPQKQPEMALCPTYFFLFVFTMIHPYDERQVVPSSLLVGVASIFKLSSSANL